MPKLIIFVPDTTLEAVKELAQRTDTTISEAVRICIRAHLGDRIAFLQDYYAREQDAPATPTLEPGA